MSTTTTHHPPPAHTGSYGGAGDYPPPRTNVVGGVPRKKYAWVIRSWLFLDQTGQAQTMEAGKHAIMKRTGLPPRDLRNLDPVLSYPSSILGRERAIVVNLEHIRAVITAQEVLFLNYADPLVAPFVKKLQEILKHRQAVMSPQEIDGANNGASNGEWASMYNLEETKQTEVTYPLNDTSRIFPITPSDENQHVADENQHSLKILPFEFVTLEACVETTCTSLDNEAKTLEEEAHPALDKLTAKISTLNLERVRQIKSRLVAMTRRVQKVRDELEHLLDDDGDMAEMYLTDKFEQQQALENSSISSENQLNDINKEVARPDMDYKALGESITECEENPDLSDADSENDQVTRESTSIRRQSHRTDTTSQSGITNKPDVEELEMILEAYFVQIEGTLNRLSNLREYVDDTEDYINIMLDDKQNHLLQMGVLLTTGTLISSAFVVLTAIFGMNITIDLFDPEKAGMPDFLWTVAGGVIGCVVLFIAAYSWYKHQRLLE